MAVRNPNRNIPGAGQVSGYNFQNVGIDADDYRDMRTHYDRMYHPEKYKWGRPDADEGPGTLTYQEQGALNALRRITGQKTYAPTTEDPGAGEGSFTTGRIGFPLFEGAGGGGLALVVVLAGAALVMFGKKG